MKIKDLISRLKEYDQEAELIYGHEYHIFTLEPTDLSTKEIYFKTHPHGVKCHIISEKYDEHCKKGVVLHY